jgi:hypothetical protein
LTTDELEGRYRVAKELPERSWWQILWLLSRAQTAKQIANSTSYSRYWIGQIARRYNEQGTAGMHNRQHTTSWRPYALGTATGGTASGDLLPITASAGRPERVQRGWDYLQRLKHIPQLPLPQHAAFRSRRADHLQKTSVLF